MTRNLFPEDDLVLRLLSMKDKTALTPHLGSAVGIARLEIEPEATRIILEALNGQIPQGAINGPLPRKN